MTCLDDHEDRDAQDERFEQVVKPDEVARTGIHDWPDPFQQEPGREKIETLEGMESNIVIGLEFLRGQNDYRGDPAHRRDVTEDGCGTG